jgi:uncharacterized membrane protein YbjE (DUF340 family)
MEFVKKAAIIGGAVFLVEFATEKGLLNAVPATWQKYAKLAAVGLGAAAALKFVG